MSRKRRRTSRPRPHVFRPSRRASQLEAEIKRLQDEIAAVKKANQAAPDTHDYNEEQTRDAFIDLLLHEAGWPLNQTRDREYPVNGMPNNAGEGFVDYVLWGDDGKPLALVEAKRTKRDARVGQQQAKLYADCLEKEFGAAPDHFLHQRLRALDLGRCELSAARGAGISEEGRADAVASASDRPRKP